VEVGSKIAKSLAWTVRDLLFLNRVPRELLIFFLTKPRASIPFPIKNIFSSRPHKHR
jgi:hypothetical protein